MQPCPSGMINNESDYEKKYECESKSIPSSPIITQATESPTETNKKHFFITVFYDLDYASYAKDNPERKHFQNFIVVVYASYHKAYT
jgi:hypothetical protein